MTRAPDDQIATKLLADPAKVEVLGWLREPVAEQRRLGQLASLDASIAWATRIYDAGAVEVWAVDIDCYVTSYADGEVGHASSGKLVVRLPKDADPRQRFFRWEAKHAHSLGFEGRTDEGQEYVFLPLD